MKIRTLLIEDEEKSRQFIRSMLQDHAPFISLEGEAGDVDGAVELINNMKPELVITDIQLYGRSAFDIFRKTGNQDFQLVFITAFEEFAISALRLSAVDYLLKPVSPMEFKAAMEKVRLRYEQMQFLMGKHTSKELVPSKEKLIVSDYKEIYVLKLEDIVYIGAEGNYSSIKLLTGKTIVASKSISEFEEALHDKNFFRTHKSYLINISHISKYIKGRGGEVEMSDGSILYVSSRKKDEFLGMLAG